MGIGRHATVREMILAFLARWRGHLRLPKTTATAPRRTPTTATAPACGGDGFKGGGVGEAMSHFSQTRFMSIIVGWRRAGRVPGVVTFS